MDEPIALLASQASSHSTLLEPMSGATLYEVETARREKIRQRGKLKTGCAEVDDAVLLGGWERGSVVGVSAEDGDAGLLVGLQTVAHALVFANQQLAKSAVVQPRPTPRVAIITTQTATSILLTLREVIRAQVQVKLGPTASRRQDEANAEVRRCLEQISISRVFDVEGLWEVLSELEAPPSSPSPSPAPPSAPVATVPEEKEQVETEVEREASPGSSELSELSSPTSVISGYEAYMTIPPLRPAPNVGRLEVGDSEDEDEGLSLSPSPPAREPSMPPPVHQSQPTDVPSSPPPPPPSPPAAAPAIPTSTSPKTQDTNSHMPDIILITHFSSLLKTLFTRAADDKASAHKTLQLLSSHLRYLARSFSSSSEPPLIMLLNSTTTTTTTTALSTSTSNTNTNANNNYNSNNNTTGPPNPAAVAKPRALEPTLRSIFTPGGVGGGVDNSKYTNANARYHNKPAFGATFAQFLDLHVLCTRVPRTRADAAASLGGGGEVKHCFVVEVLLDELGVWEWRDDEEGGGVEGKGNGNGDKTAVHQGRRWKRRCREQRWGAVDVRGGVRFVDALLGVGRR
ncbi:hypothetical protein M426DRAFT_210372 [Hypoxylon sp. CI-4A]|nr:hypothetical protein M426DRAFT_210372 [Hypoxylon sp. CI-4A]